MMFETLDQMKEYIEKDTPFTVIPKTASLSKEDTGWMHTDEGRKILNAMGIFQKQQMINAIKEVFDKSSDRDDNLVKHHQLLLNKIRNM